MPFSFFRIKVTYEVSSKLLAWSLVWSILRKCFPFHYYNIKHKTSGFQNYGQTTDFCVDNTLDASGNIVEIALKCEVLSLTKVPLFVFLRFDSVLKERLFLIYCSQFWGAFNDKGAFLYWTLSASKQTWRLLSKIIFTLLPWSAKWSNLSKVNSPHQIVQFN